MIPFYWIDGFHEYDLEVAKQGDERFEEVVRPIAEEQGFDLQLVNVSDLVFGYDQTPYILWQGRDILADEACARVPYANLHPQTERMLHSLARIILSAGTWRLLNVPLHLDRHKERIIDLARLIGARTVPSCFAPDRISNRRHLDQIEAKLGPYPYIFKPTSLFAGLGVVKVDDRSSLGAVLDLCAHTPYAYLIQPFLANAVDCRVYLANCEVIACKKRRPKADGYLSGNRHGGVSDVAEIDEAILRQSQELARRITSGFLCVDWLVTGDQVYLSEIDLCGTAFGLPEPKRSEVLRAMFECAHRMPLGHSRSPSEVP